MDAVRPITSPKVAPISRTSGDTPRGGELASGEGSIWATVWEYPITREIVTPEQWSEYSEKGDLDFAYALEGVARFRARDARSPPAAPASDADTDSNSLSSCFSAVSAVRWLDE